MRPLREAMASLGDATPGRVDRDRAVIKGVKVVGKTSRNGKRGRRYTDECLTGARRLYEGVKVRINHGKQPGKDEPPPDRDVADTFGQLKNVRVTPDGLRADLHYLKSHPLSERVCEAAERAPALFGLSHDVPRWAETYDGEGVQVITEIYAVDSVDIVADPGSTGGLFESHRADGTEGTPMRIKLSELLEREPLKARTALVECCKKLTEAGDVAPDMMTADVPTGPDAPEQAPDQAINTAFENAVMAVVRGEGTMQDKIQKIKNILKAQEDLMASGALSTTTPLDETPAEAPAINESLRREVEDLKREKACRTLCESLSVRPTATVLKSLTKLDTDQERRQLLREMAVRPGAGGTGAGDPAQDVTDGKTLAELLLK